MTRIAYLLAASAFLIAADAPPTTSKPAATKPEFTKTAYDAWTAKEAAPEKALRAELAILEGRIVFSAGLGVKDGKNFRPVVEGEGNWEIYSVRADGTDLKNLTRNSARDDYPRVSPDGARIAFASDRELPPGTKTDYQYENTGIGSIVVMNADGSEQKKVCDGVTPAWSADGKRLAFSRGKQVVIRDLATGKEAVQTPGDWRNAMYPDFAPDGVHILATGVTGRGYHIYAWEFDPATMARKGDIRQVSSAEGCNAEFAADGKAFLWVQDHGKDTFSRLYRTDLDWAAPKPKPAVRISLHEVGLWEYFPSSSPCSRYLTYALGAAGKSLGEGWTMTKEQELYVAPQTGGVEARVTFGGLVCRHPTWSGKLK